MKTLNLLMVVAGLMTLVGSAEAKGRKGKPVVCESYSIVEDRGASEELVAVCYDHHTEGGLTLRFWSEVKVNGPEGAKTVVIGWR